MEFTTLTNVLAAKKAWWIPKRSMFFFSPSICFIHVSLKIIYIYIYIYIHCYMTMDQQLTLISHQKSSISSVNREATVKRPRVELCRANSAASIATTCPSLTSISRGTAVSWCVLRREWMGCWGLLGWWHETSDDMDHSRKLPANLSTSKYLVYIFSLCGRIYVDLVEGIETYNI